MQIRQSRATISLDQQEIQVDTTLLGPVECPKNSLVQLLGEWVPASTAMATTATETGAGNEMILRAVVIRVVDGMDVKLYQRAINAQREALASD